jgi:hypothetical protein
MTTSASINVSGPTIALYKEAIKDFPVTGHEAHVWAKMHVDAVRALVNTKLKIADRSTLKNSL